MTYYTTKRCMSRYDKRSTSTWLKSLGYNNEPLFWDAVASANSFTATTYKGDIADKALTKWGFTTGSFNDKMLAFLKRKTGKTGTKGDLLKILAKTLPALNLTNGT
jgi:hypothetical protein